MTEPEVTKDITKASFWHKKVLGVPMLYLLGALAIVIGIVAWRLKPAASTTATPDATTSPDDSTASNADAPFVADDSGILGTPDNTTVTTPVDTSLPNASIPDNDSWISQGIQWLITNMSATGTDATAALQAYVNGNNLSYEQSTLVNAWIKQAGPPPNGVPGVGQVAAAPAQRQFTEFPGVHVIKGSNDNDYTKLAQLYYGRTDNSTIDLLQAANIPLGHTGPWGVGTKVNIPKYSAPRYVTATAAMRTASTLASKNGISQAQLQELNDTLKFPVKAGTKVRVA